MAQFFFTMPCYAEHGCEIACRLPICLSVKDQQEMCAVAEKPHDAVVKFYAY